MTFLVKVIGPAGRITYLSRGREVLNRDNATCHPHPSGARRALDSHAAKIKGQKVILVVEPWDVEPSE